jgi:ABC-type antimicrobial peptide transport system permease subunit
MRSNLGTTDLEKIFQVFSELLIGCIFGGVAGVIFTLLQSIR